jgi:threonylcarbamoyladenosine tRNA methylthiotransferase MtaB
MTKVLITTLGCKVNQFESAAFKTGFEQEGITVVSHNEKADLIVINTCAVTAAAGAQSRQTIRQALRLNPAAAIIITGCYAELAAKELAVEKELRGRVYSLVGNSKKDGLVAGALVSLGKMSKSGDRTNLPEINMGSISAAGQICRLPVKRFGKRSRAYLRVQDGCESFCTYCIVPSTRGPSRSLPVDEVIEQARIFTEEGHKEIVLTGIHLGYYGKDLRGHDTLVSLLDKLTVATPQTSYRISSLEPLEINESLLSLMRERKNIQPHLHIPLQSGSDEILARMNRRYTTDQFREVIELCHERLPDAAIGIDILAGFPGETDAHFTAATTFLQSLHCSYLHVFPYSTRPGTVAAGFKEHVPKTIKNARVRKLRLISDAKRNEFYQDHLHQTRPVLVEGRRDSDGMLKGFTDNYIAVRFVGPDSLFNSVTHVRLLKMKDNNVKDNSVEGYGVIGERVAHHEN